MIKASLKDLLKSKMIVEVARVSAEDGFNGCASVTYEAAKDYNIMFMQNLTGDMITLDQAVVQTENDDETSDIWRSVDSQYADIYFPGTEMNLQVFKITEVFEI